MNVHILAVTLARDAEFELGLIPLAWRAVREISGDMVFVILLLAERQGSFVAQPTNSVDIKFECFPDANDRNDSIRASHHSFT